MNQRNNVPFPAIIECILMLIMCEILRETDLKFPSSFGSAASILGALILGEAAVQAGIVSPIMIIITSITFITNLLFTQINMVKTIRYIRTIFLLSASILGLYGIGLISILLLSIMSNIETYKGDYI
jgi:spore germination protein KA